jgi:translation initiation factor 2B subunit (eIF-2B alpha/beta/delta family)
VVRVAEWAAARTDAAVTLTTEAGLPTALDARGVDAVLVGADAITPDGDVVNKTGTRVLALAARDAGLPVYAAASTFKIRPTDGPAAGPERTAPAAAVYDGDAAVSVHAPTFETVPAALVDGVACETGVLDAADVRAVAEANADAAAWVERSPE